MKKKKNIPSPIISREAEIRKEALLNALKLHALFSQDKITIVETSRLVH